jgi:hypothetical protein
VSARRRREPLIGLLTVRDDMRYLRGLFENVSPHVDGWVVLDNGSSDGSREHALQQPNLLELLEPSHDDGVWRDGENHERLTRAAWEHTDGWLFAIDPDERVEHEFGRRARAEMARADGEGVAALTVHLRELWDRPDRMRVDGVWGAKHKPVLYRATPDHVFDTRPLHGFWAPLNHGRNGKFPQADLYVYHLHMLHEADRHARRSRYERLDPDHEWQPIGYAYLTETDGIELAPLPPGRGPWPSA